MMKLPHRTGVFALVLIMLMVLLCFPVLCADGIKKGMDYSVRIIIPSLFPYMVLSSFMIRSGADEFIGFAARPLTRLLGLPDCAASAVILGLVGGFPVGAKCTSILYHRKKINSEQAQRMMCFCICPGPAFLITALGNIMLGNNMSGVILYASQIISSLLIGIILGLSARINKRCTVYHQTGNVKKAEPVIPCLIGSASDGAESIIGMTALILVFSMFSDLISAAAGYLSGSSAQSGIFLRRELSVIIPVIMEVTGGCQAVKDASMPLWAFSLCVGFGGMCVHFQIFSLVRDIPVSIKKYLAFRILNSVLSAAVTRAFCVFYAPAVSAMTVGGGDRACFSAKTVTGSIAMLVMSVIFVVSMQRDRRLRLRG